MLAVSAEQAALIDATMASYILNATSTLSNPELKTQDPVTATVGKRIILESGAANKLKAVARQKYTTTSTAHPMKGANQKKGGEQKRGHNSERYHTKKYEPDSLTPREAPNEGENLRFAYTTEKKISEPEKKAEAPQTRPLANPEKLKAELGETGGNVYLGTTLPLFDTYVNPKQHTGRRATTYTGDPNEDMGGPSTPYTYVMGTNAGEDSLFDNLEASAVAAEQEEQDRRNTEGMRGPEEAPDFGVSVKIRPETMQHVMRGTLPVASTRFTETSPAAGVELKQR